MSGADRQLIEELREEMKTAVMRIPSMKDMMLNAAEGFNFVTAGKSMYGVAGYKQPETVNGHIEMDMTSRFQKRIRQDREDQELRDSIRHKRPKYITDEEMQRELRFREKEESYIRKESDQEKDAKERNEQFDEVSTEELEEKAEGLRVRLQDPIDLNDALAAGEREYHKQYLQVVEDLIKTQNSKGKFFGNYKKHYTLAREKYDFYTKESARLIGKEQAKILMSRDEYRRTLEEKKQVDPFPNLTLSIKDVNVDFIRRYKGPQGYATFKKALIEYRIYAEKVYELKKNLDALNAVEAQNTIARNRALAAPGPVDEAVLERSGGTRDGLIEFKKSLEKEIAAWKFYADSCAACIRFLANDKGEMMIDGAFSAEAGYVRSHFGVEMDGIKGDVPLKKQKVCRRIGFECDESDFEERADRELPDQAYFPDKTSKNLQFGQLSRYRRRFEARDLQQAGIAHAFDFLPFDEEAPWLGGYGQEASLRYALTGLERQQLFEWQASWTASEEIAESIVKERGLKNEARGAMEESCQNMTVFISALPSLGTVKDGYSGKERTRMLFHGMRDEEGDFSPLNDEKPDSAEISVGKTVILRCMENLQTIRKSTDENAVTAAIRETLPFVNAAFEDIDAFMTVGKTSEIFTAKSHEEVFNNTAGLPTFEKKTRQTRDIISSMLSKKQSLLQAGDELDAGDLYTELFHKWMFLNRVLNYVDYRMQVMEKGYSSTPEEWYEDKTVVESFWEKSYYETQEGSDKIGEFLSSLPQQLHGALGKGALGAAGAVPAAAAAAAGLQEDEDEESESHEPDVLAIPIEGEEDTWSETDKKTWRKWHAELKAAAEETERKKRDWDALMEGYTRTERKYLRREYYQSNIFTTRKQQKDAILVDLLKASEHAAYSTELFTAGRRLSEVESELAKKPADQKLLTEKGELDQRIQALSREMNAIMREADRKADELLKLVEAPVDQQPALTERVNELLAKANEKHGANDDGSEDARLVGTVMPEILQLKAIVTNPGFPIDAANQKMSDLVEHLEQRFLDESKKFFDDCFAEIQAWINMNLPAGYISQSYVDEVMRKVNPIDKIRNRTDLTIPYRLSLMKIMAENAKNHSAGKASDPFFNLPFSAKLIEAAISAQRLLQSMEGGSGKKAVAFSEKVTVAEFNSESEKLHEAPEEIDLAVEEKHQEIRRGQTDAKLKANYEALTQTADQITRIEKAQKTITEERGKTRDELVRFGGASLRQYQADDDLEEDDKEVLTDLTSLWIPLDQEAASQETLKLVFDDSRMQQKYTDVSGHVRNLMKDDPTDQEVSDAVRVLFPLISEACEDLKSYILSEEGSKLVRERIPCDFSRQKGEPEQKDNYTEDMKGLATLKIKANCLFGVIKRLDGLDKGLSGDERKRLRDMREKLMRLTEYLDWREDIFMKVRNNVGCLEKRSLQSYMSLDPVSGKYVLDMVNGVRTLDYFNDVRANPEDWSHPAFKWED